MDETSRLLALWQKTSARRGGKKVFSRLLCLDAPYFAAIQPQVEVLQPGHAEVAMRRQRKVTDRLGQIHTMAMCNLAELTGRLLAEVTIPATWRWSTQGIVADYLDEATTTLTAVARIQPHVKAHGPAQHIIHIEIRTAGGTLACRAQLTIRVTPKPNGGSRRQAPAPRLRSRLFHA